MGTPDHHGDELIASTEHALPAALVDDMLHICVVADDDAGTMSYVNRKLHDLLGYRFPELIGQPLSVIIPDVSRSAHAHYRKGFMMRPSIRDMGDPRGKVAIRCKDGHQMKVRVGLGPENIEGVPKVEGYVSAVVVPTDWR